jgi:hypothetical protein
LALYSEKKAPNFSSLYQRIICSKFDWNWRTVLEKMFNKSQCTFTNLLLFYLKRIESPSRKNDLCQPWLKLVQRFWRRSRKCKSLKRQRQKTCDQKSSLVLSQGCALC